jgi:ribonuclease D
MNWAMRPLPKRMADYALNDIRYLHTLAQVLREQLRQKGRLDWVTESCAALIGECSRMRAQDPDELWRIKGSDRLDRPAMGILRELWRWREEEALAANKPPYFIFSHESLVGLALALSRGKPANTAIPKHLPHGRASRLREAIAGAMAVPASAYPHPRRTIGTRLTREQRQKFEQLKRLRDLRAEEMQIDPTVIASKADLFLVCRDGSPHSGHLMRWQRRLLDLE